MFKQTITKMVKTFFFAGNIWYYEIIIYSGPKDGYRTTLYTLYFVYFVKNPSSSSNAEDKIWISFIVTF